MQKNNFVSAKEGKRSDIQISCLDNTNKGKIDQLPKERLFDPRLFFTFGAAFVVSRAWYTDDKLLSMLSLVYFLGVSSALWAGVTVISICISTEFVSLIESIQRWHIIKNEYKNRWNYYKNIEGG